MINTRRRAILVYILLSLCCAHAIGATDPQLNVKGNGLNDQITLKSNDTLSVTVDLTPGSLAGTLANWWIIAKTPSGNWYSWVYPTGWTATDLSKSALSYQGPLVTLNPTEILNASNLATGDYYLYFGIDTNTNGVLGNPSLRYSTLKATVEAAALNACSLTANTSATATVTSGCTLISRDSSACQASRIAQGLSGAWLKFSCRVTLTKSGSNVILTTDSQPDYKSNYFSTGNACYTAYTPSFPDPGTIGVQNISMTIPISPGGKSAAMPLGVVGAAINGVSLFNNSAAPGDDIYQEAFSFDQCQGHPAGTKYHYHSEPYSISYNDSNLIGVLRDGYFLYGRKDQDGSTPTLDIYGGHTGTTPDSPSTPVYHYHTNLQSSGTRSAWFLTTGNYKAAAGACTGCL
ncbi:MAG: YHYH protein [Methylobacter sp.]